MRSETRQAHVPPPCLPGSHDRTALLLLFLSLRGTIFGLLLSALLESQDVSQARESTKLKKHQRGVHGVVMGPTTFTNSMAAQKAEIAATIERCFGTNHNEVRALLGVLD